MALLAKEYRCIFLCFFSFMLLLLAFTDIYVSHNFAITKIKNQIANYIWMSEKSKDNLSLNNDSFINFQEHMKFGNSLQNEENSARNVYDSYVSNLISEVIQVLKSQKDFHQQRALLLTFLLNRTKLQQKSSIEMLRETVYSMAAINITGMSKPQPQVKVPLELRLRYSGYRWHEIQLPILTAKPEGRTGNVMGEYATLYALHRLYNVSVVIHPQMEKLLMQHFPYLSINRAVADSEDDSHWHHLTYEGDLYNYSPYELAAAGLFGPKLFELHGYGFEMQLFNLFGEEILREFTFSSPLKKMADDFLHNVSQRVTSKTKNITFIGVHIRRTDYADHMKVFNGTLPGKAYFTSALAYYRRKFDSPIFIASSDDREFLKETFNDEVDVYITNGSAVEDMTTLASCNHSIITLGSYGFWTAYLAGGEVVYPDIKTQSPYRFSRPFYEEANLINFTPLNVL